MIALNRSNKASAEHVHCDNREVYGNAWNRIIIFPHVNENDDKGKEINESMLLLDIDTVQSYLERRVKRRVKPKLKLSLFVS
jgi:hypothetical protein